MDGSASFVESKKDWSQSMPARVSVFINTLRVIYVSLLPLHSLAPLPSSASRQSVKDCRSTLWAPARYLLVLTPFLTHGLGQHQQ